MTDRHRSAITGKFVTDEHAEANPDTTVSESPCTECERLRGIIHAQKVAIDGYREEVERLRDELPIVRTVGDLTALDALPVGSVVMEGSSGAPIRVGPFGITVMPGVFHRFPDGWHVVSGHGVGTPEFDLGPLTVLHIPCEVLS